MASGWGWQRTIVSLRPPDRWHMDNIGNYRDIVGDYTLSSLPGNRTRLDITYKVRPKTITYLKLSKLEWYRGGMAMWRKFTKALERDYTKKRRKAARGL